MTDEDLRIHARRDIAGSMSLDDLEAFARAEIRACRRGQEHYLQLCLQSRSAAAAHLEWRVSTGDLTEDRVRLAGYCGHAPALLVLPPRRDSPEEFATWLRRLPRATTQASELIRAAQRLANLLVQEWVIQEDFYHRDPAETDYWSRLLEVLWRTWEFHPTASLRAELAPLLEQGRSLRLAPVEQEILLADLVLAKLGWEDTDQSLLLKRLELQHLDDGRLLERVVRSNVALWSLRLTEVQVWHCRPTQLLREDYPLLAL